MQERHVTVDVFTHELARPFMVFATQNPVEYEGTYPLPEAQLDRFMLNVTIDYRPEDDEVAVVLQTTARDAEPIRPIFTGQDLLRFQRVVRGVPIAEEVARYAVRLVSASRPRREGTPKFIDEWVRWGAGLRAAQFLVLGGKTRALLHGRHHVSPEDIRALALPVLRHRVLLGYRAEADGVTVEGVIGKLLEAVPGL
jgi:MoxR-like ATPase